MISQINKISKIEYPKLLILLFPILLVTGPFLPDLSVFLLILFYFYDFLNLTDKEKKIEINFFKKKEIKLFLFFYIIIVLHSIFSDYLTYSLKSSLFYIRFLLFAIALRFYFSRMSKLDFKILLFVLYFIFAILNLDAFIQYFTGKNLTGYEISGGIRLGGLFGDELILGSYLSRFIPVVFGLLIYNYSDKLDKYALIGFLLFFFTEIVIFLSGERAAFFFTNLAALFLIISLKKFNLIRLSIVCLSFLAIIILSSFNDTSKKRIIDKTVDQIGLNDEKKYIFSKHHSKIYNSAWIIFEENNFIGIGPKNLRKYCEQKNSPELDCYSHPHNHYLQILVEGGLIAFLIYCYAFIFLVYQILKHIFLKYFKNQYLFNDVQLCFMSCLLILFWPLIPNGNLFNNWINCIFFYQIGLFLWSFQDYKKGD